MYSASTSLGGSKSPGCAFNDDARGIRCCLLCLPFPDADDQDLRVTPEAASGHWDRALDPSAVCQPRDINVPGPRYSGRNVSCNPSGQLAGDD